MTRKLIAPAVLALAATCAFGQTQASGILFASDFNAWTLPQANTPTAGMIQWPSAAICQISSNGYTFTAVKVGRPLTIVDVVPSQTETVIPTAVTTSGGSCTVTAPMTYTHLSYHVQSGTYGLQEAIDYAQSKQGGAVVVTTPSWAGAGGITGTITSASGSTAVSILDERVATLCAYGWNGSAYAAVGCSTQGSTITGVTAGTGITGGGLSGDVTVNVDAAVIPFLASANTFTGAITDAAPGAFGSSYKGYISSLINNADPGAIYAAFTGAGTNADAIAGAVKVPLGSAQYQVNGVAGYIQNLSTTTNATAVSGYGLHSVSGGRTWASNFAIIDTPTTPWDFGKGSEIDVQPQALPGAYTCSLGADFCSIGLQISLYAPNSGGFGSAIFVNRDQNANSYFRNGLFLANGCCGLAAWIGAQSATTFPSNSQIIRQDAIEANGTTLDSTFLFTDATLHSTVLAPPSNGNLLIQSGNVNLQGLTSSFNGPAMNALSLSNTVAGISSGLDTALSVSNLFAFNAYNTSPGTTTPWTASYRSQAGASIVGAWYGQQALGNSQPSQLIRFDGTTAGGSAIPAYIGSDALGNLDFIPDAGHGVVVTQGNLSLSNGAVAANSYSDGGGANVDQFGKVNIGATLTLPIAGTQCLHSVAGLVSGTGSDCGAGGGTMTSFAAPSGSWPAWLVPTVTNPTTTASLAVAASAIPNSALANAPTINTNAGPFTFNGTGVSCTGGTCTFSTGTATTPFPQHTYYIAAAGSDSNAGTFALPWLSPNHALNCGDVLIALPGTYTASNFASGKWGTVTCPNSNGVAWLQCQTFDACKISAGGTSGMIVSASFWGVQGWEITTSSAGGPCFATTPPTSGANIHHIVFANDVANGCANGGFSLYNNSTASIDYVAVVGSIAYNAAQGSLHCFSGISVYQPIAIDSGLGTHIYVAGNFSYGNLDPNPCNGTTPSDGNGAIFDTFDGAATSGPTGVVYTQQAVMENNVLVDNGGRAWEYQTYTKGTPSKPTVFILNNTGWGNAQDPNANYNICTDGSLNIGYGVLISKNIDMTTASTACTSHTLSGINIYDSSASNSAVTGNMVYTVSASNINSSNDDGNTAPSTATNTTGTNPTFAGAANPSAPSCGGKLNVVDCMSTVVTNFTASAAASLGLGYQPPTNGNGADPYFPQWLCRAGLPAGIITKSCQ